MSRVGKYVNGSDVDDLESLTKRLMLDLRSHIKGLEFSEVGTDKWISMVDAIVRISNISTTERSFPKENKDATLWDCEEAALRYILEDGKMNLCLRLLVNYWDYKQKNSVPKDPENHFNRFEINMGIILNNLWQHTEALQTTDKYLLINYIGTVLKDVLASSKTTPHVDKIEGYQPAMILSYLKSISSNVERLIASDIMPCIKENELLSNLILFLVQFHDLLGDSYIRDGVEALSNFVEVEEFQMEPDEYITPDAKKSLVDLPDIVLEKHKMTNSDDKTHYRALTDYINKVKRRMFK